MDNSSKKKAANSERIEKMDEINGSNKFMEFLDGEITALDEHDEIDDTMPEDDYVSFEHSEGTVISHPNLSTQ